MSSQEDLTVRAGLLMEAVESQRVLAGEALERLHERLAGLDDVVREEIRATLLEELRALGEEGRQAAASLRGLRRAAHAHLGVWSIAIAAVAAAIPLLLSFWLLPRAQDVAALRSARAELTANLAQLTQQGARVQLRRCGAAARLCVRIDRAAPGYGDAGEFAVIKGY